MAKKQEAFKNALVEKRNVLNEIRNNSMSLQELRFFSIYLSKINARDISSRIVRFPINDFQRIMGMQTMNYAQIKQNFTHILQQVVSVPNENGKGFTSFQLFKRCRLIQKETGEWYVEIDAHDDALPLMFDFKRNYFTYELWNALRLKSVNQIRMYEILKQYEKIGHREMTISELRTLLGIVPDEYARWERFKVRVLDSCQQALKENTDICYTYERGKVGRGGAWLTIIFHIFKNDDYIDQLLLDEFLGCEIHDEDPEVIDGQLRMSDEIVNVKPSYDEFDMEFSPMTEEEKKASQFRDESLAFLAEACNYEFDESQMRVIKDKLIELEIGKTGKDSELERYEYLLKKYHELNAYQNIPKDAISRRYGLMVKYLLSYV